jgi:tetratricopeptide (TPR) repeat protein
MTRNFFKGWFGPAGNRGDDPRPAGLSDAPAWVNEGKQLRRAGQLREAIQAFERAMAAGAQPGSVLLELGAVQTQIEDFPAAERSFAQLVALDPGHADAWCMLGVVTKDQQRFTEALPHFERALELQPALAEAHFNLGLALFELGRLADASVSFAQCAQLRRGAPWTGDRAARLEHEPTPPFEPSDMAVTQAKLRHDCEQLAWLLERGLLPPQYRRVMSDYQGALDELRGRIDETSLATFDARLHPLLQRTYKRPVHLGVVPPPQTAIINPQLDFEAIQDRYLAADPHALAIDDLLTAPALEAVRRFCRESMFWNNIQAGYLGAYFYDGFCSELLLRLAWELRERLPRVIGGHAFNMMWGFKCDSRLPGLGVHADAAAVNVNFWITEDEANLDAEGGGLRVYEHDAPRNWNFLSFNGDANRIQGYLDSIGSVPTRYPYRANRAVMFDSDLFHATDDPHFRDGYAHRRINITLLYGNRLT